MYVGKAYREKHISKFVHGNLQTGCMCFPFLFFLIISSVIPCRVNNSKCRSDVEIVFLQTTSSLPVLPFIFNFFFIIIIILHKILLSLNRSYHWFNI